MCVCFRSAYVGVCFEAPVSRESVCARLALIGIWAYGEFPCMQVHPNEGTIEAGILGVVYTCTDYGYDLKY